MKILVTGGNGFMGSAFIRTMAPHAEIINIDKLTYAGNKKNLAGIKQKSVKSDITNKKFVEKLAKKTDVIINYAAETHVDRSIKSGESFVKSNVLGTFTLLEAARKNDMPFIHISTDEVYGSAIRGKFKESSNLLPNSPYAASKAASDLFVRSFIETYGLSAVVVRSCNVFGHHQHPEKFIPHSITNLLQNKKIQLYGNGKNIREWVYVDDHASAIKFLLSHPTQGIVNIGTGCEKKNIEVAKILLEEFGLGENMTEFVADRPGHDYRYAMNWKKLKKMGWRPQYSFESALNETINWYKENERWWKPLT